MEPLKSEPWRGIILSSAVAGNVIVAKIREAIPKHGLNDVGAVAVWTEVTEYDLKQAWMRNIANQLGDLWVW